MTTMPLEPPSPIILSLVTVALALFCYYILLRVINKPKKRRWLYGFLLTTIVFSVTFIYFWQTSLAIQANQAFRSRAVIADQIDIIGVYEDFIPDTLAILRNGGYTVSYYHGKQVSVDFYRNLATYNYRVIILRTHSRPTTLFTGEQYDESKYIYEQVTDQLVHVIVSSTEQYFGVTPKFVEESMNGQFQNTVIIAMGCDSLSETDMAKAFIEKGAKVYIGWTASLLLSYTDRATELLLKHLITEHKTIEQAVTETMEEIGTYPTLSYYPSEAGTMVVSDE